jgi:methyl-accepting chemotaxis protein
VRRLYHNYQINSDAVKPMSKPVSTLPASTPAWLRPGVNWFRRMMFPGKSAVVLLLLLAPLIMLLVFFARDHLAMLESTANERRGVAVVQAIVPAMQATQLLRRAVVDRANGKDRPDLEGLRADFNKRYATAMAAIKLQHAYFGGDGDVHIKEIEAAYAAAQSIDTKAPAAEQRKPLVALSGEFAVITPHFVDSSGLALDPEGDSYYLMLVSMVELPDLMEAMGLTRGAMATLARDGISPATVAPAAAALAVDKASVNRIQLSFGRALEFNAGLKQLKFEEGLQKSLAFFKAADATITGGPGALSADAVVSDATVAIQDLLALQGRVAKTLDGLLAERESRIRAAMTFAFVLTSLLVLAAGYFFYCFYRAINGGMQALVVHMHEMAGGDLSRAIEVKGSDETAVLMRSLAEMQQSLCNTVAQVRETSAQIIDSASEVASGTLDLSRRTEQSAANLEETASAMEQIGSRVATTTDGSQQASQLASGNVGLARRGGEVIGQVVQTMDDIRSSSQRIGEIIGVIDGIAFQTNILALNAAVEAARAGEHGRGFAVVATEVRALAGRSASAAREIKSLIVASGERVESGSRIVSDAGSTMSEIVASTEEVGGLLQGISAGAREQASGISQIAKAIHELDQMTQQNAALVEQTAAASDAMRDQAQRLVTAVDVFKLP